VLFAEEAIYRAGNVGGAVRLPQDPDLDLAVRCAWLSLIGGRTHEEIALRVGASRTKVTRLIQLAQRAGLVKVFVEGAAAECVALEDQLATHFRLAACTVTPDLDETGLPLLTLGAAGAHVLAMLLARPALKVIGVGHGRTLAAAVNALPLLPRRPLKLVSLLGSLTRAAATNPYDVIYRLAERAGGTGYYMPAPFFCDSVADREVLLSQRELRAVLDLARSAPVMVVGIGALSKDLGMIESGMIRPDEQAALLAAGAAGEVLGNFVDAEGRELDVDLNHRAIGPSLDDMRGKEVVAIAGGPNKHDAIAAILRTGVVSHLVTDERTARKLAGRHRQEPGHQNVPGGKDARKKQGTRASIRSGAHEPS
jgi:DNA-binding transcriptional regulator LsrR (DeoR family)